MRPKVVTPKGYPTVIIPGIDDLIGTEKGYKPQAQNGRCTQKKQKRSQEEILFQMNSRPCHSFASVLSISAWDFFKNIAPRRVTTAQSHTTKMKGLSILYEKMKKCTVISRRNRIHSRGKQRKNIINNKVIEIHQLCSVRVSPADGDFYLLEVTIPTTVDKRK